MQYLAGGDNNRTLAKEQSSTNQASTVYFPIQLISSSLKFDQHNKGEMWIEQKKLNYFLRLVKL